TLIWKAAVCGGFDSEDVVSLGLAVSLPTGPKVNTTVGEISSVLIQPWLGWYTTLGECYTQGFTGVVVPTDSMDTVFAFGSLVFGKRLYESCKCKPLISFVAAQIE